MKPRRSGFNAIGWCCGLQFRVGSGGGGSASAAYRGRKSARLASIRRPSGSRNVYSTASCLALRHSTEASTQVPRAEFHHHTYSLGASSRVSSWQPATAACPGVDCRAAAGLQPTAAALRPCTPLEGEPGSGDPGAGDPGADSPLLACRLALRAGGVPVRPLSC